MKSKSNLIKMNKKGQLFTDLFIFIIGIFVMILVFGIFIYVSSTTYSQLKVLMSGKEVSNNVNYSEVASNTMGDVDSAYSTLYWIVIFLVGGMIISIFVGCYLVTTKPIFFIPYIIIVIIATIISIGISNAYESIIVQSDILGGIFSKFTGGNVIMFYLPLWIIGVGLIGGIIMYARLKIGEREYEY